MMKKGIIILTVVCLTAGLIAGCGGTESGDRKIRIGCTLAYTSCLQTIAGENGYFEDEMPENVAIEYSRLESGTDVRDAIVSDSVDIGDMSTMIYLTALSNDLPLLPVCAINDTIIRMYSGREDISSIKDFDGNSRIVMKNRATIFHSALLSACKEAFGDPNYLDDCIVPMPAADAVAALGGGNPDFEGAILSFPNTAKAEAIDGVRIVMDLTELSSKDGNGGFYVARENYVEENPDIIEAYLRAVDRAAAFVAENPDKAAQILSDAYGVEKEYILEAFEVVPPDYHINGQAYDTQGALLFESGILEAQPQKLKEMENYESLPLE